MSSQFYDEFYRQRRNLILISVVICFVLAAELSWSKVSIWGNELNLKNPDGFVSFLWVIWAYWVWRFGVYALRYEDGFIKEIRALIIDEFKTVHKIFYQENECYLQNAKCNFFRCELTFYPRNHINSKPIFERISGGSFYKFVMPVIVTSVLGGKSFNDQVFPFLVALFPVIYVALK